MSEPLYTKYRPKRLEDVKGQEAVVTSLSRLFNSTHLPHTFLFTGPSGTGKTTLARIIASNLGCEDPQQVDAATHTGIDSVRALTEPLAYRGLRGEKKVLIIDECHSLTSKAWQALLKVTEEPPDYAYFIFCTTEGDKVPETIWTRATPYELKPVSSDDLMELLLEVSIAENLQVTEQAFNLIISESGGSPRRALVYLSMVDKITDPVHIQELILEIEHSHELIELLRMMVAGRKPPWSKIITVLGSLQGENPESLRLAILSYLTTAILNSRSDNNGGPLKYLALLESFSTPFNPNEKLAPLILALGKALYIE